MIDPLVAIIAYLSTEADLVALVGNRIAEMHKFGMKPSGWVTPSSALVIQESAGPSNLYIAQQTPRLVARCYGKRPAEAKKVYLALVDISRRLNRAVVSTGAGRALIYWLHIDSLPTPQQDPDLTLDYLEVYLRANVAETPVP